MSKIQESVVRLQVSDGTTLAAFSAKPEETPKAGLLVFQEVFGINPHMKNIARRLAQAGYWAIAPELFHRTAPEGFEGSYDDYPSMKPHAEALTDEGLLADAKASYDWLQKEGGISPAHIGSVGFCLGGKVSFMANAFFPMKASVSFYGTRILTQFENWAKDQKGPLLLIWGGKDKSSTSEQIKVLGDALRNLGKDFINSEFSEAGHGFNCDDRASYHAASAETAWAMTLAFFKKHLA